MKDFVIVCQAQVRSQHASFEDALLHLNDGVGEVNFTSGVASRDRRSIGFDFHDWPGGEPCHDSIEIRAENGATIPDSALEEKANEHGGRHLSPAILAMR